MFGKKQKKGFTLIEMLIIVAIVAALVTVIVPTVSTASLKAQAATDAANLRTILGILNVQVVDGEQTVDEIISNAAHPVSKVDNDATLCVVYDAPGFIDVYYVNQSTGKYYGLDYLSDVATNGTSSLSTDAPTVPDGSVWYTVQGE